MSTVREEIHQAMASAGLSHYQQQAEPVITALEAREAVIRDNLLDFAVDKGLSEATARDAISEAGLPFPAPQSVDAGSNGTGDQSQVMSILNEIRQTLAGLTSFARANGYRG